MCYFTRFPKFVSNIFWRIVGHCDSQSSKVFLNLISFNGLMIYDETIMHKDL